VRQRYWPRQWDPELSLRSAECAASVFSPWEMDGKRQVFCLLARGKASSPEICCEVH
jgi:hypothetical protein